MNKEQRKEVIRQLDDLTYQAEKLKKEFWYLSEKLYQDKSMEGQSVYGLSQIMAKAVNQVIEVNDSLKKLGVDWIKACVVDWYRFHWEGETDTLPPDPEFESVTFKGRKRSDDSYDAWEIIYYCTIEGRQKMVAYSDGANDFQVYSVDPA